MVNTFINNEKRKIDNKVRMYEIHAGLNGARNAKIKVKREALCDMGLIPRQKILLQEHRRFLREGLIEKRKKGYLTSVRQTEKWLFLFNDICLVSLARRRRIRSKKPYQTSDTKVLSSPLLSPPNNPCS